jgi:hypothetical protein
MQSSPAEKEPVLDYTNQADWSEYWRDLTALNLWQYTDPNTQIALPLPTSTANREIIKQTTKNFTQLRQHFSKECRKLLSWNTTNVIRAGCDRGTILPLIAKVEAFHKDKWEAKDNKFLY